MAGGRRVQILPATRETPGTPPHTLVPPSSVLPMVDSIGDVAAALATWEPRQLALGHRALARTREMVEASQFDGTMVPGDPLEI